MKRIDELRQQAERFRRLEMSISDAAAIKAINELSDELEMTAAELERHHRIRERAHEIWLERGCPTGRDVEHWVAAEREIDAPTARHRRRRA
jgi:transcription initiation factor TFIIIB Brf1 subunit/transcription initiation factor TFIIB